MLSQFNRKMPGEITEEELPRETGSPPPPGFLNPGLKRPFRIVSILIFFCFNLCFGS